MGAPRITIGDGSLYIRTARLLSTWDISEHQLLSPRDSLRLNRVSIFANGERFAPKPIHDSLVIDVGPSITLTVQVLSELSGRVCISLEGDTFFAGHWRAIGDQTFFYDAPGVHIQRVTVDGVVCYEAPADSPHHAPPLRRGFHQESGCRLEITVASASIRATKAPALKRPNRLKRKRAAA